jgi:hypothetical protein
MGLCITKRNDQLSTSGGKASLSCYEVPQRQHRRYINGWDFGEEQEKGERRLKKANLFRAERRMDFSAASVGVKLPFLTFRLFWLAGSVYSWTAN